MMMMMMMTMSRDDDDDDDDDDGDDDCDNRVVLIANRAARAETRERTGDLQIFGLTLSQLSYRGGWRGSGRAHRRIMNTAMGGCAVLSGTAKCHRHDSNMQ